MLELRWGAQAAGASFMIAASVNIVTRLSVSRPRGKVTLIRKIAIPFPLMTYCRRSVSVPRQKNYLMANYQLGEGVNP